MSEVIRPSYFKVPAMLRHRLHPIVNDPLAGKWCGVYDELGKEIFEGWFSSCWKLVKNLTDSEVTPLVGELFIRPKKYCAKRYTHKEKL